METIKDVYNNIRGEIKFEWKFKNFQFPIDEDMCYRSPEISFCSITCRIVIYSDKCAEDKTTRWIELCVEPKRVLGPITVDFSFYLKTVDGKADSEVEFKHSFKDDSSKSKYYKFITRSKLIKKESELLPSGTLTVMCIMKKNGTGASQLQQDYKEFLQNQNLSDIVLRLGNKKLKSHRCILAARSPVFLAMLTNETQERNTGIVNIQDVDMKTFVDFRNYVYTGNEEIITLKNAMKLYIVADKYQVNELKIRCLDCMMNNLSVDNFCDILSFSLAHAEKNLTDTCSQFFIENTLLIVETPKWQAFFLENPATCDELYKKHFKECGRKEKD